jgi:multiple sugar transport system permease protein
VGATLEVYDVDAVEVAAREGARPLRPPLFPRVVPYLFVAPAVGLVLVVTFYPFVYSVYLSFLATPSRSLQTTFTGLGNYREVFTDPVFYRVIRNTLVWTIASTLLDVALGLVAAVAVNNLKVLRGAVRAALLLPYVVGYVVASYAWLWLLHGEYGLINGMLVTWHLLREPVSFLTDLSLVLPSLILANVWKTFPFAMLMLLAGLQNVPEQLVMAARMDRASAWRTFWEVTVPAIWPVLTVTALLLAFHNFNSFTIPWIMTGGGPLHRSEIITNYIYNQAFTRLNFGLAAATSCVTFALLMIFAVVYVRALSRGEAAR